MTRSCRHARPRRWPSRVLPAVAAAQAREVTTAGFDAQRTNWIRSDVRIDHDAIADGSFKFLWKHTFPGEPKQLQSLTQPVLQDFLVGYIGFKSLAVRRRRQRPAVRHRHRSGQAVLDDQPDLCRGDRQRRRAARGAAPAASSPRQPVDAARADGASAALVAAGGQTRASAPSASPGRAPPA